MSGTIRIVIADDHPLTLHGIRSAIESEDGISVVGEAVDGHEAVQQFRDTRPDVTLLDLQMPRMNGFEAMTAIRQLDSHARIIILTTFSRDVQVGRALKAGALGYLLKDSTPRNLASAIRDVASGKRHLPSEIACSLAENLSTDWLTSRETEILRGVACGSANKFIAGTLGITEDTVKGHMTNIMSKLRANDRTHAVMIAMERGFLDS